MASTEEAPSPLECIRNAYTSGLYLLPEDLWAIDFTVATVLASKTHKNTEPPFGCLVGPPASGKTEILRPVLDWVGMTQPFTEATANAFMSGSPTVTKSLLDRLDRRTLVMQDMTALMSRNPTKWDEFFGTIRCAFDGTYAKASGAKEELRKPKMHFTLVGAVTEAIYNYMDKDVDMGQRFLFIRLARTSGRAHRYMQFQKSWAGNNQSAWRDTTRQTVREQLDRVRDEYMTSSIVLNQSQEDDESEQEYQLRVGHMAEEADTGWTRVRLPLVTFPVDMVPVVFALANTVTRVRSAKTDFMKGAEREEGVNRIAKQFHTLASCRAISELRDTASGSTRYYHPQQAGRPEGALQRGQRAGVSRSNVQGDCNPESPARNHDGQPIAALEIQRVCSRDDRWAEPEVQTCGRQCGGSGSMSYPRPSPGTKVVPAEAPPFPFSGGMRSYFYRGHMVRVAQYQARAYWGIGIFDEDPTNEQCYLHLGPNERVRRLQLPRVLSSGAGDTEDVPGLDGHQPSEA